MERDSFAQILPKQPERLDPLAREVLEQLCGQEFASEIIIGGGVALQHYLPFRTTVDLDAWWQGSPTEASRNLLLSVMQTVANHRGYDLHLRRFRDTESYELKHEDRKVFSFQISKRTIELDVPLESSWPPVRIETFRDNLGAKMNAVVNRGAPRDFVDVFKVCESCLTSAADCWKFWQEKNPGHDLSQAKIKVMQNLLDLETRRPLDSIPDGPKRLDAAAVRSWIKNALCET